MQFKSCSSCKHRFIAITAKEKCKKSEIKLGHAIIYENCSTARSREDGCGPKGLWHTPIIDSVHTPKTKIVEATSEIKPPHAKEIEKKIKVCSQKNTNYTQNNTEKEEASNQSEIKTAKTVNSNHSKTVKFYSVKKRSYVEIPVEECWKARITKAKGKQTDKIRFSIKAKDKDGTNLSKFCSREMFESLNCPEK